VEGIYSHDAVGEERLFYLRSYSITIGRGSINPVEVPKTRFCLNQGHNNYGVQTAARSYFGKSATNLNLAESAMMAGLIKRRRVQSVCEHGGETSTELS